MAERTCSIEDCDRTVAVRGWCELHYQRWWKHGDPLGKAIRSRIPAVDRFLARVDKRGPDECWPWTGRLDDGYGRFRVSSDRVRRTHQFAYELWVGPVPSGLELDHTCHGRDTSCRGGPACPHRRCVNPAHLEPVTMVENQRRSRKLTCKYGHPFTPENTNYPPGGGRQCRTCNSEKCRIWYQTQRRAASSMPYI